MWLIRPAVLAPLLCLIYCLLLIVSSQNPLILVTLSYNRSPDELKPFAYSAEGYDGESVYYIARDPATAQLYIDAPAYRYQRILLPFLGRVLMFGQVALLPAALLLINLVAIGIGTAVLENMLAVEGYSRWLAVGYAFSAGIFGATRLTTTEPLAYGLVLVGIACVQRDWIGRAAFVFALAGLTKEPTLFFPAAYGIHWLYQRQWRQAAWFALVPVPFILWQIVLYIQFGQFGIASGGATGTGFTLIPLGGFLRVLTEGGTLAFLTVGVIAGLSAVLPTLWGLWQAARDAWQKEWTLATTLLFVQALLMLFIPFSTYSEPVGIIRFIVGLQIAVILYAAQRHQTRPLIYSTFWFTTSLIVILSDFAR